jgi:hypothetical protein
MQEAVERRDVARPLRRLKSPFRVDDGLLAHGGRE